MADYIAHDNPEAALRLLEKIEQACRMLGDRPLLWRARPGIAVDAHSWATGRYLILYRPKRDGVEIVRVVHGARNLDGMDF